MEHIIYHTLFIIDNHRFEAQNPNKLNEESVIIDEDDNEVKKLILGKYIPEI